MKRTPVFLLCGLFLMAFFLLGRGLVAGPETEKDYSAEQVQTAPFFAVQAQTQETRTAPSAEEHRETRGEAVRPETEAPVAPVCSCDRNGMPLTARTWQKTVYLVCPPEGVPG